MPCMCQAYTCCFPCVPRSLLHRDRFKGVSKAPMRSTTIVRGEHRCVPFVQAKTKKGQRGLISCLRSHCRACTGTAFPGGGAGGPTALDGSSAHLCICDLCFRTELKGSVFSAKFYLLNTGTLSLHVFKFSRKLLFQVPALRATLPGSRLGSIGSRHSLCVSPSPKVLEHSDLTFQSGT